MKAGLLETLGLDRSAVPTVTRKSLTEETADRLRRLIIEEHLAPGTRLREKELSELFGVSRTPLREALKLLAVEGLVEILPNRGAQVASVDPAAVRETFEILAALEGLAGERAAGRATDEDIAELRALHYQMALHHQRQDIEAYFRLNQEIHRKLVATAGNATLADLHEALNAKLRWARFAANEKPARWDEAMAEHEAILAAFAARDGATLSRLLRAHLEEKVVSMLMESTQQ